MIYLVMVNKKEDGQLSFAAQVKSWLSPPQPVYRLKLQGSKTQQGFLGSFTSHFCFFCLQLALALHSYMLPLFRPLIWVGLITDQRHPFKGLFSLRGYVPPTPFSFCSLSHCIYLWEPIPCSQAALFIAEEACKPPSQLLSCPMFLFSLPSLLPT